MGAALDLRRYAEIIKNTQTVRVRGRVTELTGLVIKAAPEKLWPLRFSNTPPTP